TFYTKAPVKAPTLPVKPPAKAPVKAPSPAPIKAPAPSIKLLPPMSITASQRCKCVPPGTFGNKEMCGKCYTEMTTHGNRPKCP
ncbi:hypothetical protein IFM89_005258, partial [Coptis chinensis]